MNRGLLISLFVLVGVIALVSREAFVHHEVSSVRSGLIDSLINKIENAPNRERLYELTSSLVVYNQYLEPVISTSQSLLWPLSRTSIIREWKREVHSKIEASKQERLQVLRDEAQTQIDSARSEESPSLARLEGLMTIASAFPTELERIQILTDELDEIRSSTRTNDQNILSEIKDEGRARLVELKEIIQPMGETELFDFIVSGEMYSLIQKPVVDKILDLRQTSIRAAAWREFNNKFKELLNKKSEQLFGQPVVSSRMLRRLEDTPALVEDNNIKVEFVRDPSKETPKNPSKSK